MYDWNKMWDEIIDILEIRGQTVGWFNKHPSTLFTKMIVGVKRSLYKGKLINFA